MAVIETWFNQDLQKPVQVHYLDGNLFSNNGNGNRIGVIVTNNGEAVTLTGTVSGYAVLADGTEVPCTGTRSGNKASILIPPAAYLPGAIFVSVFLTDGNTVTTLAAVSSSVLRARTDNQVDPGSVVTDWTQTINAAMQDVVDAAEGLEDIVATPYEELTFPVPLGAYTIYNHNLYRCTTPIATSESFTAAHWSAKTNFGQELSDLNRALNATSSEMDVRFTGAMSTVPLSALDVYADGKYMPGNGTAVNSNAHRICSMNTYGVKSVKIATAQTGNSIACAILKNASDTVLDYWEIDVSTINIDLRDYSENNYTLYINWLNANSTPTSYYNSIGVYYVSVSDTEDVKKGVEAYKQVNSETISVNTNDLTVVGNGYINPDGSIGSGSAHRYFRMNAEGLRYIKFTTKTSVNLQFIVIKDSNDNVIFNAGLGTVGTHEYVFDPCPTGSVAYINQFSYATVPNEYVDEIFNIINYPSIAKLYSDEIIDLFSINLVNKPFVFSGKSAVFCGDSITRGYINGSSTTNNGFPKLFSDAVGMTFTNAGVGGATLSVVSGLPSIQTQIENASKTCDYLFIAGGVNDWQLGVDLDDFEDAVETICTYVNANYPSTTQVIWITPINQGGYETTHTVNAVADLQDYRNIITRIVEIKTTGNMSVLQGNLFGFPSINGNSDLKTSMFGDLLHPTEHGYKIYAQALRTYLC